MDGKNKRVRFEDEDDNHENERRQVKRRIVEISLPKSSLLTTEEKSCYWMQPEDHRDTLHDVMSLMHECHHPAATPANHNDKKEDPNRVPFAQYAEALALTFTLCDTPPACCSEGNDNDDEKEEEEQPLWNIRDSRSVAQLALWASHHTPTRGVESKILPGLHQERQIRRARTIQGVLEAQTRLGTSPQDERVDCLGAVSRGLSHSAKQFATALAVVDGTQAYLEYTKDMVDDSAGADGSSELEECKKEPTPCTTPTTELEPATTASGVLVVATTVQA